MFCRSNDNCDMNAEHRVLKSKHCPSCLALDLPVLAQEINHQTCSSGDIVMQICTQDTYVYFIWAESHGFGDHLKEMATHSSILAWRIPWTEGPCGLQSMGSQESDMTE